MKVRMMVAFAALAGLCTSFTLAAEPAERPEWDQKEAVKRVKAMIAQESRGDFRWDNIEWLTDQKEAAERAKKENKPIFVYFFLKKNVGPAAAPC